MYISFELTFSVFIVLLWPVVLLITYCCHRTHFRSKVHKPMKAFLRQLGQNILSCSLSLYQQVWPQLSFLMVWVRVVLGIDLQLVEPQQLIFRDQHLVLADTALISLPNLPSVPAILCIYLFCVVEQHI